MNRFIASAGSLVYSTIALVFLGNVSGRDYPKSIEEVLAHSERLDEPTEIQAKREFFDDDSQYVVRCAVNSDLKLIVVEVLESNGSFRSEATVRSHHYLFTATRSAPGRPWLLTKFISPINSEAENLMEEKWRMHRSSLYLRDIAIGIRLRTLLTQPDIVEVKLESPESDGLVRLSLQVPDPEAKIQDPDVDFPMWVKNGEVRLDPSQQYCVASEFCVHSRFENSTGTMRVLEWGEKEGRKFPLKKLYWDSKYGDTIRSEVEFIRFSKVPEREFTLEAFGLPNPYASTASDSVLSPTVIMVVAGVCLLALGLTLRIVRKS